MSHDIALFDYSGQQVRTLTIDGEPWFLAGDSCKILDLGNVGQAVAGLDDDEKSSITISDGTPGNPNKIIISEAGLYSLIIRSRKSEAKAFKRWITHDVLPQIRKTGGYGQRPALPSKAELAQWVIEAEEKIASEQAARVEAEQHALALEAPASAWTHMASSAGDYGVADAAKVLSRDPAITIGRDRLFRFMNAEGWTYRDRGLGVWCVYQTQIETGRLREKLNRPYLNERTGEMEIPPPTIRVTPKGLAELHKRLGGQEPLVPVGEVA